jgi:hypothetical protein
MAKLALSLLPLLVLLAPSTSLGQSPASAPGQRLFGTDEAPPPGAPPSGPRIVMRLEYTPAEGCPEDQVVRASISAQVRRWDPFAPNAPWRLVAIVSRSGTGFAGTAELRDVTGAVEWSRVLAPRARCFDLVEDLAVTLALRINPPAPPSPSAPASPSPPPSLPVPPSAPSPDPSPPLPPTRRTTFRAGLGTWLDLATAPRPAFGLTLDLGVRYAWFSVAGELRWDPPAGATTNGVDASTALVTGALVPCGHASWFVGCLVAELGQIRGSVAAISATPDHQATLYGRAGTRLGVEIPIVRDRLFVRLAANLLGAPVAPRLRLLEPGRPPQVVWESSAFTGGFGAGLGASF